MLCFRSLHHLHGDYWLDSPIPRRRHEIYRCPVLCQRSSYAKRAQFVGLQEMYSSQYADIRRFNVNEINTYQQVSYLVPDTISLGNPAVRSSCISSQCSARQYSSTPFWSLSDCIGSNEGFKTWLERPGILGGPNPVPKRTLKTNQTSTLLKRAFEVRA